MSPTIMRSGPYRLFFYSNESGEPVSLSRSTGFAAHELRRIQTLVCENQSKLLEAWHEFFAG